AARTAQKLSRDLIVALTAGEETGGLAGAYWLARNHRDLIDAELALNEGGGLTVTPDLSRMESVEIGVAEKTFQSYSLIVKGKGGHSSMPPTNFDPVVTLARALQRPGEPTQARLARAVGDPAVELKPLEDIGFAKPSPTSGPVNEAVHGAVRALWGEVPVSHAMGTGATDSRHLRAIGIQSYGLGGAPGTLEDARAGRALHGADERRPIRWLGEGVRFLREVTLRLAR